MKLIIGLGNPGKKYKNNRHNAGYLVLDKLAQKVQSSLRAGPEAKFKVQNENLKFKTNKKLHSETLKVGNLIFVKPLTYMNNSGKSVRELVNLFKIKTPEIWVIHDDLDIKLGEYKIQRGKGPKDHKGLLSIYKELGTENFWHVRVGIENRKFPQNTGHRTLITTPVSGKEYVLKDFTSQELGIIEKVVKRIVEDLTGRVLD